jgi:thioredoxin-related protein
MKEYFIHILVIAIILAFISCQEKQSWFEISANLDGFEELSKVLISDISNQKILDSTVVIDGKFFLNGVLDNSPSTVNLIILSKNGKERNYTSMFMGNEKITISGNKLSFRNGIEVLGSKYNGLKVDFDKQVNSLNDERGKKLQQMFTLRNEGKWNDSLQSAYWSETGLITKIDKETSKITEKFISDNINSHFALSQLVTNKNDFSKEFIQNQLDKLGPKFRKTKYVNVLKTYLANKPLENGASFYNFQAENQNGESVDFASFFNNDKKFTLLEFYSPHCSWCKKALPEVKELEKSENKKLQVITYNVDKSKEDWLKTTKANGITWTTLWNENGRYSDAYTKYRVFATPTYYLFDKNGDLMRKWAGYHEKLIVDIKKLIE